MNVCGLRRGLHCFPVEAYLDTFSVRISAKGRGWMKNANGFGGVRFHSYAEWLGFIIVLNGDDWGIISLKAKPHGRFANKR